MNGRLLTNVCVPHDLNWEEEIEKAKKQFDFRPNPFEKVSADINFTFGLVIRDGPVEKEAEMRPKNDWDYFYRSHVCILMPHLNTAVIINKKFYEIPHARKKLIELNYVPVQRTIHMADHPKYGGLDSDKWIDDVKRSILSAIRSEKYSGKKSVDSRLVKIVNELSDKINVKAFTFGTFKPGVAQGDSYSLENEFHDRSPVLQFYRINPRETEYEIGKIQRGLSPLIAIGLTSEVLTRHGERHIPMIDFDCNFEEAVSIAQKQKMDGAIVASGKSYHFYGFDLLKQQENIDFLNSLKEQHGVDHGWVGYQLKRGYSNLRITPALGKFYQPCFIKNVMKPSQMEMKFVGEVN